MTVRQRGGRSGAVRDQVIKAVQGPALQAAVDAASMIEQQAAQQRQAMDLELEQARYEAQLAQRRYESVDPQQRLVAAELESRWNTALERVMNTERRIDEASSASREAPVIDQSRLQSLAHDLEAVWEMTDGMQLKQRIVRLLIQEVVADVDDVKSEIALMIHWVGGRHTEVRLRRTPRGEHGNATSKDVDAIVRSMAGQWPDGEIACTLNRLGLRTGVGNTWTAERVLTVRKRLRLVDFDPTQVKPMLSLNQAADKLGVGPWVIRRLVKLGVVQATHPFLGAPWQIDPVLLEEERVKNAAAAVVARKIRPGSKASQQLNLRIPNT